MNTYEALENELADLLQALKPEVNPQRFEVGVFPELAEDQANEKHKIARIYVAFAGADYPKVRSTSAYSQDEKLQFNLTIRAKKRRGPDGAYELVKRAIDLVLGYKSSTYGCTAFYLLQTNFAGFENNEWSYTIAFALDGVVTQQLPAEDLI